MLFKLFGPRSKQPTQPSVESAMLSDSPEGETTAEASTVLAETAAKSSRPWLKPLLICFAIGGGGIGAVAIGGAWLLNSISCGGMPHYYEGRSYAGSMNRAQQAFYLENGSFTTDWEALGLGTEQTQQYYQLITKLDGNLVLNYALAREAQQDDTKEVRQNRQESISIVGAVTTIPNDADTTELSTPEPVEAETPSSQAILCEADQPGFAIPASPQLVDGQLVCGAGTTNISS